MTNILNSLKLRYYNTIIKNVLKLLLFEGTLKEECAIKRLYSNERTIAREIINRLVGFNILKRSTDNQLRLNPSYRYRNDWTTLL